MSDLKFWIGLVIGLSMALVVRAMFLIATGV